MFKQSSLLLTLVLLTACSGGNPTPPPPGPTLPEIDKARGFSGALPSEGKTVSETEFRTALKQPGVVYYDPAQVQKDREAAEKVQAEQKKLVDDAAALDPDLKALLLLQPDPAHVDFLADGNYLLKTEDNQGKPLKVVTLEKF